MVAAADSGPVHPARLTAYADRQAQFLPSQRREPPGQAKRIRACTQAGRPTTRQHPARQTDYAPTPRWTNRLRADTQVASDQHPLHFTGAFADL